MRDINKFLGVMFWWAIGDALGSATEFLTPDKFVPVKDFQWRPKFRTNPGDYTDDTAQALCLAQSLLDCWGFDIEDQLDKYLKWLSEGYMSSTNRAFWIGLQTLDRLWKYKQYKEGKLQNRPREEDLSGQKKDGNGALMKIWPIPLFYAKDPQKALYYAGESCKAIHNTDLCISCAQYFVGLIIGVMNGLKKSDLQLFPYSPVERRWDMHKMHPDLIPVVKGSYLNKEKSELWTVYGYVLDSLEVALWWFFNFNSFEEGMIEVVNLWYDADTNGCLYGYLAGAYYGYDAIPERWKTQLTNKELLAQFAQSFYQHSMK